MPEYQDLVVRITKTGKRWHWDDGCRFDGVILSGDDQGVRYAFIGPYVEGLIVTGKTVLVRGYWHKHPQYNVQFKYDSIVRDVPPTENGVVSYLKEFRGVGPGIAQQFWDKFGHEAIDRLLNDSETEVCQAIAGISPATLRTVKIDLADRERDRHSSVELIGLLSGLGFPKSLPRTLIERFGATAAERITQNPFTLLSVRGCGFTSCDKLYARLAGDPDWVDRKAYCVWGMIQKDHSGNTWLQQREVLASAAAYLSSSVYKQRDAILDRGKELGLFTTALHGPQDTPVITTVQNSEQESTIAEFVHCSMLCTSQKWPGFYGGQLKQGQEDAIVAATRRRIGILSGPPGTGKSFVISRLVAAIARHHGRVELCTPTGRAAVRCTQELSKLNVPIQAKTIHRLLRVAGNLDNMEYRFDRENPLPVDFLVLDEAHAIATPLLASLFKALPIDCHVLLSGDLDQLPPVSHGQPLMDIIKSGVPHGKLTKILRSSGNIPQVCMAIRNRQPPQLGGNVEITNCSEPAEQFEALFHVLTILQNQGHDLKQLAWDFQVIAAMNKTGPLCRDKINEALNPALNPNEPKVPGCPYRRGDKVICLENSWCQLEESFAETVRGCYDQAEDGGYAVSGNEVLSISKGGKVRVANGETGVISYAEPDFIIVELRSPSRQVVIPVSEYSKKWDLGYAMSAHKASGSEWQYVVVMLDKVNQARKMMTRNWLFTALSRAKDHVWINGKEGLLRSIIQKDQLRRATRIHTLIEGMNSEHELFDAFRESL